MYPRIFEANMDTGQYAAEGGQYSIEVGVNEEDAKRVLSWNRMYKPREYPDYPGLQFFKFKRKNEVRRSKDNSIIEEWSGPPKVVHQSDGTEWEDGFVGNGSTGTLKLDVSVVRNGKRSLTFVRLEVVAIDELVPYVKSEETEEEEEPKKAVGERPF